MKINFFKHKNQNCYIAQNGDSYILKSYDSLIAVIDKNGNLFFGNDWDYSTTTSKHLNFFLSSYYFGKIPLTKAEKQKAIKNGNIPVLSEKSLENIFLGNFA